MEKNTPDEYAFPQSSSLTVCGGMTLRDYFAAKAMVGLMASSAQLFDNGVPLDRNPTVIAKAAFYAADEMLKAREGK